MLYKQKLIKIKVLLKYKTLEAINSEDACLRFNKELTPNSYMNEEVRREKWKNKEMENQREWGIDRTEKFCSVLHKTFTRSIRPNSLVFTFHIIQESNKGIQTTMQIGTHTNMQRSFFLKLKKIKILSAFFFTQTQ